MTEVERARRNPIYPAIPLPCYTRQSIPRNLRETRARYRNSMPSRAEAQISHYWLPTTPLLQHAMFPANASVACPSGALTKSLLVKEQTSREKLSTGRSVVSRRHDQVFRPESCLAFSVVAIAIALLQTLLCHGSGVCGEGWVVCVVQESTVGGRRRYVRRR
jgi:hypothetical protein